MESNTPNGASDEEGSADVVKQIKASAKEIWLAGLGAFSQRNDTENSPQAGAGLFQQLVKEGRDLERVSREQLDRNLAQVKSLAVDGVDQVRERAFGSIARIESVFDERVTKVFERVGVVKASDHRTLEARLNGLEERLAVLEAQQQSAKPKK